MKRNDFLMTIPRERKVKLGADELSRRNRLVMAPVPVAQWYFTNHLPRGSTRLLAGLLVNFFPVSVKASFPIPLSIPFAFDLSFILFFVFHYSMKELFSVSVFFCGSFETFSLLLQFLRSCRRVGGRNEEGVQANIFMWKRM